jgi:cobalt-zinc-cadmium efflux system membrane fusion protein
MCLHDVTPTGAFPRQRVAARLVIACTICLGVLACRAGGKPEAAESSATAKSRRDSTAMAVMPGMVTPNDSAGRGDPAAPNPSNGAVDLTAAQVRNGRVQWAPAVLGVAASAARVPGALVPNEDRTARLGAPARGRVTAVHVRPGDRVRAGQTLATLQSPEAGTAQADVTKAQAEVSSRRAQAVYAKAARERAERLLALKAIPRQDYERAGADDELAQASLAQAEAELRRARSTAGQLGANASAAGEIVLHSPLAGVVLERTAVPGAVVESGAPLVVVTDPASLWLSIDAPEGLTARFRVGETIHFTVPAYGDESFSARIDAVGAGLSPDRRTLPVRALIANASVRLKPEMLATVVVGGSGTVPAVLLPDDAMQLLDGLTVVFIAQPDTAGGARFTRRVVEAGPRADGHVAIMRGLAAGELVVTQGAFAVKAQLKKSTAPKMEM